MPLYTENDIWTTANREQIRFKDLTDSHVRNIITLFERRAVQESSAVRLYDVLKLIQFLKDMLSKRKTKKTSSPKERLEDLCEYLYR